MRTSESPRRTSWRMLDIAQLDLRPARRGRGRLHGASPGPARPGGRSAPGAGRGEIISTRPGRTRVRRRARRWPRTRRSCRSTGSPAPRTRCPACPTRGACKSGEASMTSAVESELLGFQIINSFFFHLKFHLLVFHLTLWRGNYGEKTKISRVFLTFFHNF